MLLLEKILAAPRAIRNLLRDAIDEEVERGRLPNITCSTGVIVRGADYITAGKNVFFDRRAYVIVNSVGGKRGFIRIGDNVEIGPGSVLWGGGGIVLGSDVHIGAHVHITSFEAYPVDPLVDDSTVPLKFYAGVVTVQDHALVGSNTVIVPGVTIGHHALVQPGSVVIEDVPPYAVVMGVPAKVDYYTNANALVGTSNAQPA